MVRSYKASKNATREGHSRAAYAGAGILQRSGTITHLPDHDGWGEHALYLR